MKLKLRSIGLFASCMALAGVASIALGTGTSNADAATAKKEAVITESTMGAKKAAVATINLKATMLGTYNAMKLTEVGAILRDSVGDIKATRGALFHYTDGLALLRTSWPNDLQLKKTVWAKLEAIPMTLITTPVAFLDDSEVGLFGPPSVIGLTTEQNVMAVVDVPQLGMTNVLPQTTIAMGAIQFGSTAEQRLA